MAVADCLKLQGSTLQRIEMLPTVGPMVRFSRYHRVPTSAYFVKRKACSPEAPESPVMQHRRCGSTTLVQLPSAWCALPSSTGSRRCIMASAAPVIVSDPAGMRSDHNMAQLPPLSPSTIIPGLPLPPPPPIGSELHEAEQRIKRNAERWGLRRSALDPWTQQGISFTSALYGRTVDMDRFVAISTLCTLYFMLDDIFFDGTDSSALEEYGFCSNVYESPKAIRDIFNHLHRLFQQQAPLPRSPTPLEGMTWEMGYYMQRLSTPTWFAKFASTLVGYHDQVIANSTNDHVAGDWRSYGSKESRLQAYSKMRILSSGGRFVLTLLEFASNVFLPDKFRSHPAVQQLIDAASLHCAYVNDLLSCSKEVLEEPSNMTNLLWLLLMDDHQGRRTHGGGDSSSAGGLPQAAWEAVDLIKAQARRVTELEQQLLGVESAEHEAVALRTFIDGVQSGMTGNFYWHTEVQRYRHPNAVFPELRGNFSS